MNITISAFALTSAGGLSVGRSLLDAMSRNPKGHVFRVIIPSGIGYEEICEQFDRAEILVMDKSRALSRVLNDRFRLKKLVEETNPDVYLALDSSMAIHSVNLSQHVFLHAPHLVYPGRHYGPRSLRDKLRHWYLKRHFKSVLGSTDVVYCQTEVMKNRLLDYYGFEGDIPVVGTAVPPLVNKSVIANTMPDIYKHHDDKFKLFYPTRYYPHKNIERIVEMFTKFREDLSNVVVFLTISPDQHPNVSRILQKIKANGLQEQIINLGHVNQASIGHYYRNSEAVFMPTLLESFSTVYVEANNCGVPIITSSLDFAVESCGDNAIYFDPFDIAAMQNAISRFTTNFDHSRPIQGEVSESPRSWADIASEVLDTMTSERLKP